MHRQISIFFVAALIISSASVATAQNFQPFVPPGFPTTAQIPPDRKIRAKGTHIFFLTRSGAEAVQQIVHTRFGFVNDTIFKKFVGRTFGIRDPEPVPESIYWRATKIRKRIARRKYRRAIRNNWIQSEQSYKTFSFASNDTWMRYDLLWGLHNAGGFFWQNTPDIDINAPEAWEVTLGDSDLIVGVIDTGVHYRHPDLADNIFENPLEVLNGIDDDGNGYIDDIRGWDFHNGDNDPNDDNFHGTHVAGTIAAVGNNNRGVVGVAPGVQILPLKVMGSGGQGDTSNLVRAVEYAIGLKKRGINIAVLNASLGGGPEEAAMRDVLSKADRAGITFVAAAGNSSGNSDVEPIYPATYDVPNVISVASINKKGLLSAFSNYGPNSVDIAAPGEDIWSTIIFNLYLPSGGTSMAAPHVAGIAALVQSRYPNFTPAQIRARIMNTAKPYPDLKGKLIVPGLVDAARAVGR